MILRKYLFWQPKFDFLKWMESFTFGKYIMIVLNYLIWIFFFIVSFLLIKFNANIFWQLFTTTLIAEFVERYIKSKVYWRRPMFEHKDRIPAGLVKSWYKTGSFPSGHTIKATYFLLFIIQNQIISPSIFLLVVMPLLFFRVLVGFHYPIDLIGGIIIGGVLWFLIKDLVFPEIMISSVKSVFDIVFLIH